MTMTVYRNLLREVLFRLGTRVEIWESSGRMGWKLAKQVRLNLRRLLFTSNTRNVMDARTDRVDGKTLFFSPFPPRHLGFTG